MRSSSLQLDDFTLVRLLLNFQRGPAEKATDEPCPDLHLKCQVARNTENPLRFRVRLDLAVKTKPGHSGLDVEAEAYGLFSFPEGTDEREMHYLARVNGGTILYGLLRGQIAMASGSFPGKKVVLPAVVMQDFLALPAGAGEGEKGTPVVAPQSESGKAKLPAAEPTVAKDSKVSTSESDAGTKVRKRTGTSKPSRKQPPKTEG